jgi:pentapeptide repeat protein
VRAVVAMVVLLALAAWLAGWLGAATGATTGRARWEWLAIGVLAIGLVLIAVSTRWRFTPGQGRRKAVASEIGMEAGLALATGAVVGALFFIATGNLEQRLVEVQDQFEEDRFAREAEREEDRNAREDRRDDIRFVREVAIQPDAQIMPFAGFDLRGAPLDGLDLSDADLSNADMSEASLVGTNLGGANLMGADLSGAALVNTYR